MSNLEIVMLEKEDNKEGLIQSMYFLSEPDGGVGRIFPCEKVVAQVLLVLIAGSLRIRQTFLLCSSVWNIKSGWLHSAFHAYSMVSGFVPRY